VKKVAVVFVVAFLLNAVWENLHSSLYINYMGGPITELILLRAALVDALIILVMSLPFLYVDFLKKNNWLILIIGLVIAFCIEWWALSTGRWAYSDLMPIVPILSVGLTPLIQLAITGLASFKIQDLITER